MNLDHIIEIIQSNATENVSFLTKGRGSKRVDFVLMTNPQNGEQELFMIDAKQAKRIIKKLAKIDDAYRENCHVGVEDPWASDPIDLDFNFFRLIRKHCLVGLFEQ